MRRCARHHAVKIAIRYCGAIGSARKAACLNTARNRRAHRAIADIRRVPRSRNQAACAIAGTARLHAAAFYMYIFDCAAALRGKHCRRVFALDDRVFKNQIFHSAAIAYVAHKRSVAVCRRDIHIFNSKIAAVKRACKKAAVRCEHRERHALHINVVHQFKMLARILGNQLKIIGFKKLKRICRRAIAHCGRHGDVKRHACAVGRKAQIVYHDAAVCAVGIKEGIGVFFSIALRQCFAHAFAMGAAVGFYFWCKSCMLIIPLRIALRGNRKGFALA